MEQRPDRLRFRSNDSIAFDVPRGTETTDDEVRRFTWNNPVSFHVKHHSGRAARASRETVRLRFTWNVHAR